MGETVDGTTIFVDEDGESFYGRCGHCRLRVDNFDANHRVTSIMRGGRGVDCVLRGDIEPWEAGPLRRTRATTEGDARG